MISIHWIIHLERFTHPWMSFSPLRSNSFNRPDSNPTQVVCPFSSNRFRTNSLSPFIPVFHPYNPEKDDFTTLSWGRCSPRLVLTQTNYWPFGSHRPPSPNLRRRGREWTDKDKEEDREGSESWLRERVTGPLPSSTVGVGCRVQCLSQWKKVMSVSFVVPSGD